jgi:hypothetical protein
MTICALWYVAVAGAVVSAGPKAEVRLVDKGKAVATLSSGSVGLAATERLVTMVEQISGADLAAGTGGAVLYIGSAAAQETGVDLPSLELGEEGFVILAEPGKVVLAGNNQRSTDYAVSTFLERFCGVRWYWPHELGTVVPRKETISVRVGQSVERPAFAVRWIGNDAEWSRHNKLNVVAEEDIGVGFKWFVHTWLNLVPPEEYAQDHPEYYALVKGVREQPSRGRQTQLCTSNPAVADAAARTIIQLADEEPNLRIVSIDPMDTNRMCECDQCTALDEEGAEGGRRHSRRVILFYKEVAERVAKAKPDLMLKGIVYWSYVEPPFDTSIRLPDNVMLQLCRFECHNHGLDDPSCPFNKKHMDSLEGWRAICKNLLLYEYYWKVAWREAPWPILHALKRDLPYAKKIGILGVASQHAHNFGSHGVVYYVAAKLLWDSEADVDVLCEDYHRSLFGEQAGKELLAYWKLVEDAAIRTGVHIAVQNPYREHLALFTPELIEQLESHLSRAEDLAENDTIRQRVRLVRIAHDHTVNMVNYLREIKACTTENGEGTLTAEQIKRLEPQAAAIGEYVNRHSGSGAIAPVNGYTRRLMQPEHVAKILGP